MTEIKEFDIIRRKNASGKNVVGKDVCLPFSPDLHEKKHGRDAHATKWMPTVGAFCGLDRQSFFRGSDCVVLVQT
jgi:hypothetical protein